MYSLGVSLPTIPNTPPPKKKAGRACVYRPALAS